MQWLKLSLILVMLISFMSEGLANSGKIKLSLPIKKGEVSLEEVLNERRSVRQYLTVPLSLQEVSQVLWASYGKNRWGRRTAPSAGALYPLTIYLVSAEVRDLAQGLYRYDSEDHSLALVSSGDFRSSLSLAALNQSWVAKASALVIICADYNITTSRYGQRGRRYVDIEVGHVGQNIYLQAQSLGLGTVAVGAFSDSEVKKILGIREEPLYIMPLGRVK